MGVRRLLLQGMVVSVVVVIGALFVLHKDSSADADVLIDRPPSDVWKVVSNSAAYRNWNPFITRVDGDFREGATIRITLGTGPDSMVFKPTVLLVHPEQDLCWLGRVPAQSGSPIFSPMVAQRGRLKAVISRPSRTNPVRDSIS